MSRNQESREPKANSINFKLEFYYLMERIRLLFIFCIKIHLFIV